MKGGLPGMEEPLQAGVAVRPLGDADHRDVVDAEVGHGLQGGGQLAGAAVDQHQVGPRRVLAGLLLLGQAPESAAQHLAHHAVVVAGREVRASGC